MICVGDVAPRGASPATAAEQRRLWVRVCGRVAASALTYLEITTVSRANLEEVLVNYPKSERIIRVTALKMAMQRAGQIISHHVQTRSRAKQLSSTLSKFAPNNALFQNHASSAGDGEAVLREMMTLVNGGKKLRRFDDGVGQIVDENENVVDADFVRAAQSAHRVSTDEHLVRCTPAPSSQQRRACGAARGPSPAP
jgi:hypothetical protein